jgi:hypothetical protein
MQFNAKDDFVNEVEDRNEKELLDEEIRNTEEDNGYDNHYQFNGTIKDMTFWEEQSFENERHGFVSAIEDSSHEEGF